MSLEKDKKSSSLDPATRLSVPQQAPEDEVSENDRKAYVVQYKQTTEFPFEVGEVVWVKKPEHRAPVGEFRISKARPNDMYELVGCSDGVLLPDLVEGKYLLRNA